MNNIAPAPIKRQQSIKIHVMINDLRKRQAFSDDDYRNLLQNKFSVRTSRDLDQSQANQLIKELVQLGARGYFKPARQVKPEKKKPSPGPPSDPNAPVKESQQHVIKCLFGLARWGPQGQTTFTRRIVKRPWAQTHAEGQKLIYALIATLAGDILKAVRALNPDRLTEWEYNFKADAEEKLEDYLQNGRKRGHRTMPNISMTKLFEILETRGKNNFIDSSRRESLHSGQNTKGTRSK